MKKSTIYIIGLSILLLIVIGVTYAFFTDGVAGAGGDDIVTTGTLSLVYKDGPEISIVDAEPGHVLQKYFTVTNTGTLDTDYSIHLNELINTITNNELVISYECKSYVNYVDENNKGTESGTCAGMDVQVVPETSEVINIVITPRVEIASGITHEYSLFITFVETGELQNYNQNKDFEGIIDIQEVAKEYGLPVLETYRLTNYKLTATVSDLTGIAAYAIGYGDGVNMNNLTWTEASGELRFNINTSITNYNLTLCVRSIIDKVLCVNLTPHPTVVINPNGGTWNGSAESVTYNMTYADTLEVPDPVREGYTFLGWNIAGEASTLANGIFTAGIANTTVTAVWQNATPRGTLLNIIKTDNTAQSDSAINFTKSSSATNGRGFYYTSNTSKTENSQVVYYFRGVVENNYLVFAGFCWRVVRSNENGSVKLRFGGEVDANGHCPQTGSDVSVSSSAYNTSGTVMTSLRYVNGSTSSKIKTAVDNWYASNILTQGTTVTSLIIDTPYCNDYSYTTGSGANSTTNYYFGGFNRYNSGSLTPSPQYKCPTSSDKYSVSTSNGNGKLSYPIALLTADEAAYAGGVAYGSEANGFLASNYSYWTMTPESFMPSQAGSYAIYIYNGGSLTNTSIASSLDVVPAMSISGTASVGGYGTYNDPYFIFVN